MRQKLLFRSNPLAPGAAGARVDITPKKAGWELIRFGVRQLPAGGTWKGASGGHELCVVLLSGTFRATFARQEAQIGRAHV